MKSKSIFDYVKGLLFMSHYHETSYLYQIDMSNSILTANIAFKFSSL